LEEIDLDQIRSHLEQLSQPGETPELAGRVPKPSFLDASEISFEDNTWLTHLVDLQLWLSLDAALSADATPQQVTNALFDQLWPGGGGAAFSIDAKGIVRLTELGAQHLEERLSLAVALRATFEAAIEDGRTRRDATAEWREAWDEPVYSQPLNIDATVGTWRIIEFADRAVDGELDLNPPYQRDFVWSNSGSQTLIDSILRGIPLPSIILAKGAADQRYQIVDGKQRLTAILRFMGKHPEGLAFANTAKSPELLDTDMGAFVRKNALTANDLRKHYLPFKTRKYDKNDPLHGLSGKYYSDIKDNKVRIAGADIAIKQIFERTTAYLIPVLEYRNTPVRDIHRVFQIYNQQGMKLNAEEIRNAVYNHLHITRLMLFIGGDRPDIALVPFMADLVNRFNDMREIIEGRGFGVVRFKRAKVLLWVTATLLYPSKGENGVYRTPSTATHIDAFLDYIDDSNAPLKRSTDTLRQLAEDLAEAVELHQEVDEAWHPGFRNKGKATKWEELPMVASLCACFVLVVMREADRLRSSVAQIRELTGKKPGPESTQNRTQWAHISDVTVSILRALGIDLDRADEALLARYQASAINGLIELQKLQDFNPRD
jgi:hypothetical protein